MSNLDPAKQDMTFDSRERSSALRAYRHDGTWHSVIIKNKSLLRNTLPPTADAAKCFAEAVAFITAAVDGAKRPPLTQHGAVAFISDLEGSRVTAGVPLLALRAVNARGVA
jgi:hypothetical protein